MPPESARAVARAYLWEKFAGFGSGFFWLKSAQKTSLIIYAPESA